MRHRLKHQRIQSLFSLTKLSRFLAPAVPLLLRLILGMIMIAHGSGKLLEGPTAAWGNFFDSLGIIAPVAMAWAVTLIEFAGGCFLMLGFLTRITSLLFSGVMGGAIILFSYELGVKSTAQGPGSDLNLALLVASMELLAIGPGRFAIDNMLGIGEDEKNFLLQPMQDQVNSVNDINQT